MGIILATTGAELMSGDRHNVISDYEGTAMLAPLYNLVPDPRFRQYNAVTDSLEYWLLGYAPKPNGWMAFVRDTNIEKNFSRQATGPIGMDQSVYEIVDELVPGASPRDRKDTVDIASPVKPQVKTYRVSKHVGLPAGWYCLAMGHIAGGRNSKRLTGPGPRSDAFELAQGQGVQMAALNEMPEGVGAVIYYLTTPQKSEAAAYNAPLYEQERYDIKGLPRFWNFYGPLATRNKWDGKNRSFVGAKEDTAAVDVRSQSSRLGSGDRAATGDSPTTASRSGSGSGGGGNRSEDISVSYRYTTEQGSGESSTPTNIQDIQNTGKTSGKGAVITVKPKSFPEGATGYIPEVTSKDRSTGAETTHDVRKTGAKVPDSGGNDHAHGPAAQSGNSEGSSQVNANFYANTQSYRNGKPVGEGGKITQSGGSADTAGAFGKDERAPVYGGQPEDIPAGSGTEMNETAGTSTTDETGVERPTDVTEVPTILDLNTSGLTPGRHYIKTALMVDEEEGPASDHRDIPVRIGEGLRIKRPNWHDRMDNSDLSEKEIEAVWEPVMAVFAGDHYIPSNPNGYRYKVVADGTTGTTEPVWGNLTTVTKDGVTYQRAGADRTNKPRGWDLFDVESNTTQISDKRGVLKISDINNNSNDANFFVTPPAELSTMDDRYTLNMRFKYSSMLRGAMDLYITEYNAEGQVIGSQFLEKFGQNAKNLKQGVRPIERSYRLSARPDDVASPSVTKINPLTTSVRCRVQGKIDRKHGTRWLDVQFSDFHMSAGWGDPRVLDINLGAAQRTRIAPPPDTVPDIEYQNFSRPHGGYCVVVENPIDGPKEATYTTKDFTVFESGTDEGWVRNVADFNRYVNSVRKEAALYSNYGLHIAKTEDGTGYNNVRKIFTPDTRMTVSWDLYIDTFSSHNIELGSIEDAGGRTLARVTLLGNGDIEVRHSSTKVQTVELGIDNGNIVHFALSCNMITGKVTLRFGVDLENSAQVVEITGIDFSSFENAANAVLGPKSDSATNSFARFSLMYGKIEVTDLQVFESITNIPGNYIEYYGPARTPLNSGYGPTGLRIPAKGGQDYTLGVNVWYEDMHNNSDLFIIRAKDRDHKTLRTYNALVNNMSGDKKRWERHHKTIHAPQGTAYLEFYENNLGAGILKIHGLQVEEGTTPHAFSYLRQRSGWFSTFMRTRQGSIEKGDPAIELSRIKALRDVYVAVLDTDVISTLLRYRSGNTFAELDAQPYTNNYTLVDPEKEIFEIRMDLASTIDGETPEIRSVELDIARNHSQLLMPDGTEYSGGTIATNITTPSAPPNLENVDLATGARITQEWGTKRIKIIKFDVQAFRRSDVEKIIRQSTHILETPFARFVLGLNSIPEWTPEPGSRIDFGGGREFFQRETASFDCYVISMESLI